VLDAVNQSVQAFSIVRDDAALRFVDTNSSLIRHQETTFLHSLLSFPLQDGMNESVVFTEVVGSKGMERKGEGLRSDDGGGDGGLSFLLGLVFFSMVVMMVMVIVVISLSSVWVWDQSSSHGTW